MINGNNYSSLNLEAEQGRDPSKEEGRFGWYILSFSHWQHWSAFGGTLNSNALFHNPEFKTTLKQSIDK